MLASSTGSPSAACTSACRPRRSISRRSSSRTTSARAASARDCSGFVSEVYSGFGVKMPRNTSDQGKSPAFNTLPVPAAMPREERLALVKTLAPGDLVYIPGHVMMVVGHEHGLTYVIHDTPGVRYRDANGASAHYPLNAVSVTPLEPLQSGEDALYIDKIYSIQRMRR